MTDVITKISLHENLYSLPGAPVDRGAIRSGKYNPGKYRQNLDPVLNQFFHHQIGRIPSDAGEGMLNNDTKLEFYSKFASLYEQTRINNKDTIKYPHPWYRVPFKTQDLVMNLLSSYFQIVDKKDKDGNIIGKKRGQRNSRLISNLAEENGIEINSPNFQHFIHEWLEAFSNQDIDYEIRWDFSAFDMLGEIKDVDEGDSCYGTHGDVRRQGEWADSPLVLHSGFDNRLPTFVIFLYTPGSSEIKARCWGVLFPKENPTHIFLSNFYYYRNGKFPNNSTLFVRAIEYACEQAITFKKDDNSRRDMGRYIPVFTNSGSLLAKIRDAKELEFPGLYTDVCMLCNALTDTDNGFTHAFCYECLGNEVEHCVICNRSVNEDEVNEINGHLLCDGCWNEHVRCCGWCGIDTLTHPNHVHDRSIKGDTGTWYCSQKCFEKAGWKCNVCEKITDGSTYDCLRKKNDLTYYNICSNNCFQRFLSDNKNVDIISNRLGIIKNVY